jgi:hypothetical protein
MDETNVLSRASILAGNFHPEVGSSTPAIDLAWDK